MTRAKYIHDTKLLKLLSLQKLSRVFFFFLPSPFPHFSAVEVLQIYSMLSLPANVRLEIQTKVKTCRKRAELCGEFEHDWWSGRWCAGNKWMERWNSRNLCTEWITDLMTCFVSLPNEASRLNFDCVVRIYANSRLYLWHELKTLIKCDEVSDKLAQTKGLSNCIALPHISSGACWRNNRRPLFPLRPQQKCISALVTCRTRDAMHHFLGRPQNGERSGEKLKSSIFVHLLCALQ